MSACRSCGARVRWVHTGERFMPLDWEPRPDGNITPTGTTVEGRNGLVPAVRYVTPDEDLDPGGYLISGLAVGARYVSHFASCPQAGKWRRDG